MNVLIVEDTEDSRIMLQEYFMAVGDNAITARDGTEALAIIESQTPDVIVSDILMPHMDGYDLCRQVKGKPAYTSIPFIFYTATYTEEQDKQLALSLGADYFILKPEIPEKLYETVKQVINGKRMQPDIPLAGSDLEQTHSSVLSSKLNKKVEELEAERSLLNKKENELRLIMDALPNLVSHVDGDFRYKYVNKAYEDWHNMKRSEMIGRKVWDIVGEEVWKQIEPHAKRAVCGESVEYETTATYRDGKKRDIWVRYIPNSNNGNYAGFIALITDISERKRMAAEKQKLQQQLMQAQKMESIGQLAGGIAHDFNNILACMIGFADLLYNDFKDGNETHKRYLREVIDSGNKAKQLVAQLLAFSRGTMQETEVIDAKQTISDALRLISKLIPSSINTVFEQPFGTFAVDMNSIRLQQIIMNLCINARDAMRGKGEIRIELANTHKENLVCSSCHKSISGDFIAIQIEDTGIGIPEENLDKIFEPFYSSKDNENGSGTGMGLSVTHGIVHDSGGHILVQSKINSGTRFTVLLPAASVSAINPAKSLVSGEQTIRTKTGEGRILIVDDEVQIGLYLQELFQRKGYVVSAFSAPKEALTHFRHNTVAYDLIITDYTMPEMTGLELSRELQKLNPDIQILLCTGYSDNINDKIAKEYGIVSFLNKPFTSEKILEKVSQLLQQEA